MTSEDTPNMVVLTPSHFFDDYHECFKRGRGGAGWLKATDQQRPEVLHPDVFWWLRENVGYECGEVWDVDRYFYPGETLPELPRGAGGAWIAAGRVSFYGHTRGEYSYHTGKQIYFPVKKHATAFRKRFHLWHQNWEIVTKAMHRRFHFEDRKLAKAIRDMDEPIFGLGSHALELGGRFKPFDDLGLESFARDHPDRGLRRYYLLRNDQDRVLFSLACTASEVETFTAKS